jgi:hypothetical protein
MLSKGAAVRQGTCSPGYLDGRDQDRHNRLVRFALVLFAALTVSPTLVCAQTPTHTVSYADGLLSLRAKNAPVADVFATLVERGLVEVIGSDRLTGLITIDLEPQRVLTAVPALLADYNYVITTPPPRGGATISVVRVRVHSRRDGSAPPTVGPIVIAELDAVRASDEEEEEPDPDEEPDPEEEADRAAEQADRVAELAEYERLGKFRPSVAIEDLAELLDEENPLLRTRALTELNARSTPEAITHMLTGLSDDEVPVRYHAVDLLGRRSDAVSLQQLGDALVKGDDSLIRYGVFMALAMRADPASVPFVEAVANDGDQIIRTAAATFLREMARRRRPAPPQK